MVKVFIDGSAGTTGLKIRSRLDERSDIDLITLSEADRKDVSARKAAVNAADIVFLCLPDAAAIESASLVENENVKIIDTSTAHRVAEGWTYGFPELVGYDNIRAANRIANPGCHASGFISLVAPLVKAGVLAKEAKLSCFSLTGYTGGGKKMIAEYEAVPQAHFAPGIYGLGQSHKHLPEMKKICGLDHAPCFLPVVAPFPRGMQVSVPLFKDCVGADIAEIKDIYRDTYRGKVVFYDDSDDNGFLYADRFAGKDSMAVGVFGNEDRITLISAFDNLGKGASGAALQNMNIMLGLPEETGLEL